MNRARTPVSARASLPAARAIALEATVEADRLETDDQWARWSAWLLLLVTGVALLAFLAPLAAQEAENPTETEVDEGGGGEGDELDLELDLDTWARNFAEGDYRKARRLVDRLYRDHPENLEVGIAMARQSILEGKLRKAGRVLDELTDAHPDDGFVQTLRAELAIDRGDYEDAEGLLRSIVDAHPANLRARYQLGHLLDFELGRRDEAEDIFGGAFDWWNALSYDAAEELPAEQHYWLGMCAWGYDSAQEALDQMVTATAKDGSLVDGFVASGLLFLDKYNRPAARKEFEAALQINPRHPAALCGMAAAHLAEFGQIEEAEEHLENALRVNRNHLKALVLMAEARMDAQDYEGAAKYVENALAVNPNSLEALSIQASMAYMTRQDAEFERIEELVGEREPPALSVLYTTVAEYLAGRHRYPDAVKFGRKAIENDERNGHAFVDLGINMTRSGDDWEEGKRILENAYDRDTYNVQVYNLLTLLDDYSERYIPIEASNGMIIRLHKDERDIIGDEVVALMEEAYVHLTEKYKVDLPQPLVIEMLPTHEDFSVRSVGSTGLGALGVCFGKVVTLLSPEGMKQQGPGGQEQIRRFNWASTAWHEFVHIITLIKTEARIPRWFTEGLSTFEEKERRREWGRELEIPVYDALMSGRIRPITDLNEGFTRGSEIMLSYYVGSLVCEFVRDEFGFEKILEMLDLYREDLQTAEVIQRAFGFDDKEFDTRFREYLLDIFAEYELTPHYTKNNTILWRERLQEEDVGPIEKIVLHSKLANAFWMNNATADAELQAVRAITVFEGLDGEVADETVTNLLGKEETLDIGDAESGAASAYIVLARHFKERDRIERAKEYFDKAFELGSDDFFAHRTRAQIAQSENDVDTAIAEYEAALEAFPRYASPPDSPYRQLYRLYLENGEEEKAFAILEAFCRVNDDDLEVRKILANHYQETGQDEKLAEILRQARFITCIDPDVNRMLASLGTDAGDPASRVRQIRSALAVPSISDEDRVRLLTDLAEAQRDLGRLTEALDTAEEAVAMKMEYFRADKVLQEIEALIAETPEAARQMDRRRLERKINDLELDSAERGKAYVDLAKMMIEDDELYDARDLLEEAMELPIPLDDARKLLAEVEKQLDE